MLNLNALHCDFKFALVAGNVVLNSTIAEIERRFSCEGELISFTCKVVESIFLQWTSPRFSGNPITYSAGVTAPTTTSRPPFVATLTSIAGVGLNTNFTSTLKVNASRAFQQADSTVQCRNQQGESSEAIFPVGGMW